MGNLAKAVLLAVLGGLPACARAASITNNASADTSLIGIAPTNNNGAQAWVVCGKIQNDVYYNRGLFKFDFSNLPTNAIVLSATLELQVTRVPDEPHPPSTFGLHRVLRPWGEGSKEAVFPDPPGRGLPATPGEATWLHAFFPTNAWSAPGGVVGVDFSSGESAYSDVSDIGLYYFGPTPELAADVQDWINQPEMNYGWLLLCNDEITPFTARRFGSREDPDHHPSLEIDFFVPPLVESAQFAGNEFTLSFTTWPGQTYSVEFSDSVAPFIWQTLTNLGLATNLTQVQVVDTPVLPQRFYRVGTF